MKVIAVIPARAGSKGIPNKNIRIINGKPLIAYCIENAIACENIDEVIVTTDSEEVMLIAKHYGVKYIQRDKALCADDVTLDSVVYDACINSHCDYVVTMQPTSPTLKVETLNNAIKYAVLKGYDTLISVVNRPHLAWEESNGVIVPAYKERLNRQYLPNRYMETGAFVISERKNVTPTSRIGTKVGVYEISENEAIDIDTFQDMVAAENVLRSKNIAIVVNGNNTIGLGHIVRMLELADELFEKPVFFYDINKTDRRVFGETTYELVGYKDEIELIELIKGYNSSLVINDILDTDVSYVKKLKTSGLKIVNFEDLGDGAKIADMVINALYSEGDTRTYSGYNYYIIPKKFLLYKPITIRKMVRKVLVCFGGADPQDYTETIIREVSKDKYNNFNFTFVLGRAKKNYNDLKKYETDRISVKYDIKNMPEEMSNCDMAITSQGRTCFELAYMGVPTLSFAQNKREERHLFVSEENGFINKGIIDNEQMIIGMVEDFLQTSYLDRKSMQNKMLATNLSHGRERVRALINSL